MAMDSYLIGLAGGTGSGKTSFIKVLKEELSEETVCFISLDDYYHPRDQQYEDEQGIKNFDLPSAIKADELIDDLSKLRNGETVKKKKYTFNNETAEDAYIVLHPAPVYIVEGLYIYHYEALKNMIDLKLFIDAKDELKLIRRIIRDEKERNYPLDDVLYRYEHHVIPSYKRHIGVYKDEADLVINNNISFKKSAKVIAAFVRDYLKD